MSLRTGNSLLRTILKFKHPPGVHYANAGALFGVKAKPDILTASFKKQWRYLNTYKPNFGLRHCGWEKWWQDAVKGTFIDAGVDCDKEVLDAIAKYLINKYTTSSCWQHCEGAIDLLSKLKANNTPIGVISNFDGRLETILENLNVRHYFDFIITSYVAGHPKPDPRIFDEALKRFGIPVEPHKVLHVGDTMELDCVGATGAGWKSWHITDSSPVCCQEGDKQALSGSLQQLQDHLFSLH